jgi:hypothetical protein
MKNRLLTRTALVLLAAAALVLIPLGAHAVAGPKPTTLGFAAPVYVSQVLGGGEPFVLQSTKFGSLVFSAHEGTTLLYRPGIENSPGGDAQFLGNYRNQVGIWTSSNGGVSWNPVNWNNTEFFTNPLIDTGFSDPSMSQDAGGTIYDTGIDLANDALFSSADGGYTWPTGTAQCHDGDRPWLAGGVPGEVFLATDTVEGSGSGHDVYVSTDYGATCSATGVPANGTLADGTSYTGDGQLYYNHRDGSLIEPAVFDNPDGTTGLGINVAKNASQTFANGTASFTPHEGVRSTTLFAHWPAIAIDSANTVYLVWDTDSRAAGTSGGCGGSATPLANSIMMTYTKDEGLTWSKPTVVAHPGTRVLWPWVAAGNAGNVSVAWWQYDSVVDPDCAPASSNLYVYDANISNATGTRPVSHTVNASGRPIHQGQICQEGTTCVASGQDRRLGDYFTNAIDNKGCVLIATSDTMLMDPITGQPLPTARPLFIKQNSGPGLYGTSCS